MERVLGICPGKAACLVGAPALKHLFVQGHVTEKFLVTTET